jgi:hypothetical protein
MFWLNYPINYAIWFNLPHNAACHFCFSIHKLNFNLRICKVVVKIIIYIKIFDEFFITIFIFILYIKNKVSCQICHPINILTNNS